MYFKIQELGYRELAAVAELAAAVSKNGICGDIAKCFYYDYKKDKALVSTENGNVIYLNNDGKLRTLYPGSFDDFNY